MTAPPWNVCRLPGHLDTYFNDDTRSRLSDNSSATICIHLPIDRFVCPWTSIAMTPCDVITPDSTTCNGTGQEEDSVFIERLRELHDWYRIYHGYLATVVCALGIVANGVNIVVLTRRSMLSAINCILTALAVSDGLTMVAYLPFALRFYVLYGVEPTLERNKQSAVRFLLFYAGFSVVVHTTSIWLTVVMATFRYIFVR